MKQLLFLTIFSFLLSGCYTGANIGLGTSVGKHGGVGTNVHIGSDGQVRGSVGVGVGGRL